MKWAILLLGVLSNASASLLVKKAVTPPRRMPHPGDPLAAMTNWPFWLGLGLYGAAFVIYTLALTRLPINVAHPILTSGAIAVVAVGSVVFFQETFRLSTVLGVVLVMVGVTLISLKSA